MAKKEIEIILKARDETAAGLTAAKRNLETAAAEYARVRAEGTMPEIVAARARMQEAIVPLRQATEMAALRTRLASQEAASMVQLARTTEDAGEAARLSGGEFRFLRLTFVQLAASVHPAGAQIMYLGTALRGVGVAGGAAAAGVLLAVAVIRDGLAHVKAMRAEAERITAVSGREFLAIHPGAETTERGTRMRETALKLTEQMAAVEERIAANQRRYLTVALDIVRDRFGLGQSGMQEEFRGLTVQAQALKAQVAQAEKLAAAEEQIAATRRAAAQERAVERAKIEATLEGQARAEALMKLRHREELDAAREANRQRAGSVDLELLTARHAWEKIQQEREARRERDREAQQRAQEVQVEQRRKLALVFEVEEARIRATTEGLAREKALREMATRREIAEAGMERDPGAAVAARQKGYYLDLAAAKDLTDRKKALAFDVAETEIKLTLHGADRKRALLELEHQRKRALDADEWADRAAMETKFGLEKRLLEAEIGSERADRYRPLAAVEAMFLHRAPGAEAYPAWSRDLNRTGTEQTRLLGRIDTNIDKIAAAASQAGAGVLELV